MSNSRFRTMQVAAGILLPACALVLVATSHAPRAPRSTLDVPAAAWPSPVAVEAVRRADDIALFQRRAMEDPYGASDHARLATLFLQRARETGSVEDYRRAEGSARQAIALRAERNGGARLALASTLLAQHRFPEARDAARDLVAGDPDKPASRALLGEIELETGDYDSARRTFGALWRFRSNLAVAPRLARWAELTGEPGRARALLLEAREQASARSDLPREQVAWFHLRVADFELRRGRLDHAEAALREGFAVDAADPRLLAIAARLQALRGQWRDAIGIGERMGERIDLATLALLGDAHLALGEAEEAEARFRALERSAAENPEPFNRQWTLFRLEHRRDIPATLALLEQEIGVRHDVYGYDQLAWARHLSGDHTGAWTAMQQALRLNTPDPSLHFHAGMIQRALERPDAARRHLERALELNPRFHHRYAEEARAVLRALRRE